MVQYKVDIDGVTFDELNQVSGATTINPFGDRFICEFLDNEGNKFDQVSPDNAAEIFARDPTPANQSNNSFSSIFEGYVVQADEGQEGSRDSLSVTIYSFDQIIRNERVSNDQSGNTIATALENIIKTDTPVAYVSGNVSVGDNRTLNRPLQGLTVEEALRVLSLGSENENYGVNNSREFFFQQRVEVSGQKDITDSDVTNYSVPERGKESKNEVTVNYNQDNDRVTVSNGSNQLNVQDSLGTQDPVGFPDEISRPSITDRQEALAEGREFLRQRENTLAGRVTVVGDTDFLSNDVGDTVNVTITPRGIDDEFVLVGKEVDYIRNEISFDIIQKRGDQDSLLKAIGQQLKREELSGTDQGTPSDKVTQTNIRVNIEQSYSGVTAISKKVTTSLRNQLRQAWIGDETVQVTRAVFGDSNSVTRADTNVSNIVDVRTINPSPTNQTQFTLDFDFVGTGTVIGFESDGELLFTALIEETTDPTGTLTVTINDGDTDKSVLTKNGQKALRDLFAAGESPTAYQNAYNTGQYNRVSPDVDYPVRVEYGDKATKDVNFGYNDNSYNNTSYNDIKTTRTEPSEKDENIDTVISQQFDGINLTTIETNNEWGNNTTITNTDRVFIENNTLKLAQSAFVAEVEDFRSSSTVSDVAYSNGDASNFDGDIDSGTFNFDVEYKSDYDIYLRSEELVANDYSQLLLKIDGTTVAEVNNTDLDWDGGGSITLSEGSHSAEIFANSISGTRGERAADVLAIVDSDLYDVGDFDNSVHQDNGYLDSPTLYPTNKTVQLTTASLAQAASFAALQTDYNDTSNGQFVVIGNGTTKQNNNAENVSLDFPQSTTTINATLSVDGFGQNNNATPRNRFNGQEIDFANITVDFAVLNKSDVGRADYEVIFSGSDANGLTLQEAGQVNSNGVALTRSIFPKVEPSGEAVIFSEDIRFDLS